MKIGTLRWVNSIHTHILGLVLTVIAALAIVTLSLLALDEARREQRFSVHELTRLVRGLPLATPQPLPQTFTRPSPPASARYPSEALIAQLLAQQLGLPAADVRVQLTGEDRRAGPLMAQKLALYGAEGAATISIDGGFTIAVKQPDGSWRLFVSSAPARLGTFRLGALSLAVTGMLMAAGLWLSARLVNSLRSLGAAAERLGARRQADPVPVTGPFEVRQAAQAFNEMQARITRHVRERTAITAAIAHDLRSPLSRLKFHMAAAPLPLRRAVENVIAEMEQLIGTTLEFAESDTRQPVRERMDLTTLVEGVVDDFSDAGRKVSIVQGAPITIEGDPLLLKRLFTNLIDNATTYGDKAQVTVTRHEGEVRVDVIDEGPGMRAEDLARAFEPFFRGEPSRNRKTGGAGLGLSIAQSAAAAHGGDVQLENRPQGGLRARVRLPVAP